MKIVYVASEVYPFFKTGGLADVLQALPKKMSELGHEVSVIMPKYDKIPLKFLEKMEFVNSTEINGEIFNLVRYSVENKMNYYFIENRNFYERGRVYGDLDEDYQYALFCEATLILLKNINLQADILHCNDWQTGPLPYFLKNRYKHDPFYWDMRVVFSIHNLMYQGRFNNYSFDKLGYYRNSNFLNFMEMGITYADLVNTVSPSYAEEIKYPYFAEGLEWLTSNKKIYGILNGIDYEIYNPETNINIQNFNVNNLEIKKENKRKIQDIFDFKKDETILITLISRLVEGKGLDLISSKIEEILMHDSVQVVILGSGSKYYEDYYKYLEYKYPNKFKAYIGYSEEMADLLYAGSDLFLMPSRYEPCGLSQMIAMRYGTIPLVRETGGLRDTVKPFNEFTEEGNGFSFSNFNADDMLNTIRYAEHIYYDKKKEWDKLVKKNMLIDNSWNKSAKEYEKIYNLAKMTA
ncbi:glycogen synthase [Streptobacillus felis]|uniref:Glycogen synthase n=1 Tax=Streptobacillus felis TaxID=1384509 RepID=A0A7Z0PFR1_9FUSO|nr:glycogen synthase [Streptobacillus felis]NYV27390.1 glycogen synthase [Streptobacillus felis]